MLSSRLLEITESATLARVSSSATREFLSFLAMNEDLGLRDEADGRVVRHAAGDAPTAPASACRARGQPRREWHRLLFARRTSLRAHAGHAHLALPGSGSRAGRRVPPTTSSGGRCSAPASSPGPRRRRRRDCCTSRIPSASSRVASTRSVRDASKGSSDELHERPKRSTMRSSTRGSPTSSGSPGERSSTATTSSRASTCIRRSRPSLACSAPTRAPATSTTLARAAGAEPIASEPPLQVANGHLDHSVPQPAASPALHVALPRWATHHGARGRARGRLRQLRAVLSSLPRRDGRSPVAVTDRAPPAGGRRPESGARSGHQANSEAPPAGLEPATCGLEVRCSIQLSYRGRPRAD